MAFVPEGQVDSSQAKCLARRTSGVWTYAICDPKWPKEHSPGFTLGLHRLEAYATLAFWTVERSPRAIPGAIAVHLE
jgi:hypothetical protein